jgi:molybdenum cofactor cytidylyltransferase
VKPRVGVVILAAGESSRLGQPKQLLPFRGKALLQCVVHSALSSRCRPVVVVIGAHADMIRPQLSGDIRIVENPDWKEGMSSSIRRGVESIESEVDAVILMLGDQPLVTSEILNQFAEKAEVGLVAAEYNGGIGVPALFRREYFDALRTLRGEKGAKSILLANEKHVARIPCPEAALDIDTVADARRLQTFE